MTLRELIGMACNAGDFDLLRVGEEVHSAKKLYVTAERMAGRIRSQVPADTAIAVVSASPWHAAQGLLAGLITQRTAALINPLLAESERRAQLTALGKAITLDFDQMDAWSREAPEAKPVPALLPNGHPAVVVFTSGSTGVPKAILHSAASLMAIVERSFALYPNGVDLISMPMHSLGGIQSLLVNLALKRCLVLPDGPGRAAFCEAALRTLPQNILCFPAFAAALLDCDDAADLRDSVEVIHTGGEKLTLDLRCALEDRLDCRVHPAYGMAEFGGITVNRSCAPKEAEALGILLPGVKMKLVPAEGATEPDIGELWVRGKSTMLGYRHSDGRFEPAGEWLATGDMVQRDVNGALWHVGRKSDFITHHHGAQLSLSAIERSIATDPGVIATAAVLTENGRVVVFVQPVAGAMEQELCATVVALLDSLRQGLVRPGDVCVMDELPLNAAGKIDRARLADAAQAPLKAGS
jgi:acyl-coenzyme A synthetase/AMP-(fatty) acid ligase